MNITGSSVGHDMMLVIDESTVLSYNLNSYYELLLGEDGTGIVKFPIPALEPGKHTAEFWVWDILNNSTVRTFTFEVVEGLKPFLFDVIATPGIAREQVTFHLMHNRPESWMYSVALSIIKSDRQNHVGCRSIYPASIFEISRISSTIFSRSALL